MAMHLKIFHKMKLTPKEIEDLVASVTGKDAVEVLRLIKNKKNVSEFKIAEKLKSNINQVRNTLYRMNERSLVGFTRKKDKKKGWYIYYWTFNEKQAKNLFIFLKKKKLEELKSVLNNYDEEESYFTCKTDFIKFDANEALEHYFKCPECGKVLKEEKSPIVDIEKIKKEISMFEADIKSKIGIKPEQKQPIQKQKIIQKQKNKSNSKIAKKPK